MLFAVTLASGPGWDRSRGLREQDGWAGHAAFMDALTDQGFVVLGGPLGDATTALLLVNADGERAVRARLEADPWISMGVRQIASVERWQILLRNERGLSVVTS